MNKFESDSTQRYGFHLKVILNTINVVTRVR
jgi:hypothetical protein